MYTLWERARDDTQQKADVHENVDIRFLTSTLELKESAPGGIRTHAVGGLSTVSLPLDYRGFL